MSIGDDGCDDIYDGIPDGVSVGDVEVDDGSTVDMMGMFDGGSIGGIDGDSDGDDDGILVGESVSDGDNGKVLPEVGLVVGYSDCPRVGCNVDSTDSIGDIPVGIVVISVGGGVKGLVGVGLIVDVIVGILLLRLLVGPNVMVGVNE